MTENIFSAMKHQQWERAKGELRALEALLGSQPARYEAGTGARITNEKWEHFKKLTAAFIRDVEDYGLHE